MEEYGLDLFQKYMRDLYIYVLETSEEILFEARQNNFLQFVHVECGQSFSTRGPAGHDS